MLYTNSTLFIIFSNIATSQHGTSNQPENSQPVHRSRASLELLSPCCWSSFVAGVPSSCLGHGLHEPSLKFQAIPAAFVHHPISASSTASNSLELSAVWVGAFHCYTRLKWRAVARRSVAREATKQAAAMKHRNNTSIISGSSF